MNKERNISAGTILSKHRFVIALVFLIFLSIVPVSALGSGGISQTFNDTEYGVYNQSFILSNDPSVPWQIWEDAIVLGVAFILLSFMKFPNGEEGLISIMAWFPLGYAALSALAVDFVDGFGVTAFPETLPNYKAILMELHTVHQFSAVALALLILTIFAIANTIRIWMNMRKLNELNATDPREEVV